MTEEELLSLREGDILTNKATFSGTVIGYNYRFIGISGKNASLAILLSDGTIGHTFSVPINSIEKCLLLRKLTDEEKQETKIANIKKRIKKSITI